MGQQEVYDFLMKHPDEWFTSKQISEELIVSIGSVTMSLKKLRKTNIIKYRNTGKRNTFQYMVQSEPVKLSERKPTLIEHADVSSGDVVSATITSARPKAKIKPKIVHQHTYLGGQTFYGVIRPKEEVDAIEREKIVDEKRAIKRPRVLKRAPSRSRKTTRVVRGHSQRMKKKHATSKTATVRRTTTKKRGAKKR